MFKLLTDYTIESNIFGDEVIKYIDEGKLNGKLEYRALEAKNILFNEKQHFINHIYFFIGIKVKDLKEFISNIDTFFIDKIDDIYTKEEKEKFLEYIEGRICFEILKSIDEINKAISPSTPHLYVNENGEEFILLKWSTGGTTITEDEINELEDSEEKKKAKDFKEHTEIFINKIAEFFEIKK